MYKLLLNSKPLEIYLIYLHLTRSAGGIPVLRFLLSVTREKKNPQVGLARVAKGATELVFIPPSWRQWVRGCGDSYGI